MYFKVNTQCVNCYCFKGFKRIYLKEQYIILFTLIYNKFINITHVNRAL